MRIGQSDEFAAEIPDGATLLFTGNASIGVPDALMAGVERRFLEEGHPRDLSIFEPCNAAISEQVGIGRFAHEGLLRRIITSAYPSRTAKDPKLIRMAVEGAFEAYMLPMGILYNLVREAGAGRPGLISQVGIGTFADPELGGGKLNGVTNEDLVQRVEKDGGQYLFYKAPKIDFTFLKATTADSDGNLTMEGEPVVLSPLSLAMAAKAGGGKVFAQVERIVARGSLDSRSVVVPGALVDGIVIDPDALQSSAGKYDSTITGEYRIDIPREPVLTSQVERVILARAAAFLKSGWIINLGVGIGDSIPKLLIEAGCEDLVTATTEHGGFGGLPMQPPLFGAHANYDALITPTEMFDFYTGGGLNATFLGMAETDEVGNLNVSWFGQRLAGAGGFVDITHATPNIFICGGFSAKGPKVNVIDGKVAVEREGAQKKMVRKVKHVTMNGQLALAKGQRIRLVTERAVFSLTEEGWVLEEIAPGINPAIHIQPMMDFELKISDRLQEFPPETLQAPGRSFSAWLRRMIEGRIGSE